MINSAHIKTNDDDTQSKMMSLIFNTHLINYIYWINKSIGVATPPHSFIPTTQLSILGIAIPLFARTVITGFDHKIKALLAHFLPQGTPILLIPIQVIIKTVSLFIQPIALAVRLTANFMAGHLLIHLIDGATLVLISISPATAIITLIILILLRVLELAETLIQTYVFTLLVNLYLHGNT